jgi:hypothetical protein
MRIRFMFLTSKTCDLLFVRLKLFLLCIPLTGTGTVNATDRPDWAFLLLSSTVVRPLPSKYNRTLEVVDRPLASVRSSVNTSPLA